MTQSAQKQSRGDRDLTALQRSGATNRVLNLSLVAKHSGDEPEYGLQPFFQNRTLNTAILVKHRLRADERYVFDASPTTATKIILPFVKADLTLGARSMFIGQRGWKDMIRELYEGQSSPARDLRLLGLIDQLPSLDPFLLREQLKRHNFPIARCYFALSPGDHERMLAFVKEEVAKLVELAFKDRRGGDSAKMVEILLSTTVDERFEPLRLTLGLDGEAYKEGVFSWKGFLYYKWLLADLWPKLVGVLGELRRVRIVGKRDPETMRYLHLARRRLELTIQDQRREAIEALMVYDAAFRDLTENGKPTAFREFLIKAPGMFMMLGERIGAISHIASFWRYRFPRPDHEGIAAPELAEILQDFEASLSTRPTALAAPTTAPAQA